MFQSKTLFVVGAGASKEARLPTGNELTATIAKMVDIKFRDFNEQFSGDFEIAAALKSHVQDINPYLPACWHIRDAMPQASSIDRFIDEQGDDKIALCGKIAIVRSILEAEKKSLLFVNEQEANPTLNFNHLEGTWYKSFLQILTFGCRKENINNLFKDVCFITFNYDRCIEHFLFYALQNYYNIEPREAATLMQALRIIHPYGFVGKLPWQADANSIPFGSASRAGDLLSHAGKIKTYSERIEDAGAITTLHRLLIDAETIVFLGFAFHDENMKLMTSSAPNRLTRVFATARGISDSDREVIREQISDVFGKKEDRIPIQLRQDLYCHQIFDEYSRTLSQ